MPHFLRARALIFALIFGLAAALPFIATTTGGRITYWLEIAFSGAIPQRAQLFYDTGHDFNESESFTPDLGGRRGPGTFRAPLPAGYFRHFRLDLRGLPRAGTRVEVRILDRYGVTVRRLLPASPVEATADGRQSLEFGAEPFRLLIDPKYWLRSGLPAFFTVLIGMLLIAALPASRLAGPRLASLVSGCRAHPYSTLAVFAGLVVAVQCHPVIFFGKSFVSPDNGALLLYDDYPTFPGPGIRGSANTQASDLGAMMWWHLYCPVIAHDALWRNRELPLWNRYSLGGVPLLGQGQSMTGDPLNWLPLLTRGAAWSWDLRFVLARWLFCAGLALTVFALTRDLAAGLVIALGAGFIGFFAFRLNHAANFSLGYAPWILFAWVRLIGAAGRRNAARWCLVLMLANFSELTSGTVKEAAALIACLNFAGLVLLAWDAGSLGRRARLLAGALGGGLVLALVAAPWWRTFLAALKHSWTTYDLPGAQQIPPARALGFFEDLFSRQFVAGEASYMPAVNFLFLLGILWALAAWRDLVARRGFLALALATAGPLALVFGGIPASAIARVPFLGNVHHIDNTFSCSLIVMAGILAGYGFSAGRATLGKPAWRADYLLYLLLLGLLCLLYLGSSQDVAKSRFFLGYAWMLVIVVALLPLGLHLAAKRRDRALAAAVLIGGAGLLLWRHGQYLRAPFADYVFNPQPRMDLRARSAAVAYVEAHTTEPSRPIGFELNLFAGYNEMLGWESILGVDPLRNRRYDDLAAAFGITRVLNADQPVPVGMGASYRSGLDLLNVRYYLALPRPPEQREQPGLTRLAALDFDVYESATAWPRAFFTDRLWRYDGVDQLAAQVERGDRRPMAAIQREDAALLPAGVQLSPQLAGRTVAPARNYRLTTNTTSFEIDAPRAGVVVLSENYYPHDFRVTVNGKPSGYFRINHAFKGVYLDGPGKYRIAFSYWPRSLNFSLQLAAVGLLGLAGIGWMATKRDRK